MTKFCITEQEIQNAYDDNLTEEIIDTLRDNSIKAAKIRELMRKQAKPKKKLRTVGSVSTTKPSTTTTISQGVFDNGVLLRTYKIDVSRLPKFFKKGMEKNPSTDHDLVIEKTER